MRELVIRVEHAEQRSDLLSFLREQRASPRQLDECSIMLDVDDEDCPPLATLVATLDKLARTRRKAVLKLDGETRILRIDELSETEREVLTLRYGIDGDQERLMLTAIGRRLTLARAAESRRTPSNGRQSDASSRRCAKPRSEHPLGLTCQR